MIYEALQEAVQQYEENAIPMSFVNINGGVSKKDLDHLDVLFMYTQILKDILLKIEFGEKDVNEFVHHFPRVFAENDVESFDTNRLNRIYHEKTSIWWYTREYSLYSTLNHALRLMNVDDIIKMGCFVRDLHQHIEQLHNEQFGGQHFEESFTVYRGQGMSKADFNRMMQAKGGLISFNSFLSTSKDYGVSLLFAESNQTNPAFVGILFVMTIDPSKSTIPFASIQSISHYQEEAEILFSMHTIFRICEIKPMDGYPRLFRVDLTLTSDTDEDLHALTIRLHEDIFPQSSGWYRLGLFLLEIGRADKSQQLFEILFHQSTNESEKGSLYHQIALAKVRQGEYQEAIQLHQKALDTYEKILPQNDPQLAIFYASIGAVYIFLTEYKKALWYYEKVLEIDRTASSPKHLNFCIIYNNIGIAYRNLADYSTALSYYEKALEINQKTLPPNHPDFTSSYHNIGILYRNMREYSKALSYYEKALEIRQRSFPPNHPSFATSYSELGSLYLDMHDYSKALSFYEKELEIDRKNLSSNHPNFASPHNNIGNVHFELGDYSKALWHYEKSLEIRQRSSSENSSKLAMSYFNIGKVCGKMGQYSKALSYYERAVDIGQRTLPPNHPHLKIYIENLKQLKTMF